MPITISCTCGKLLKVPDALGGKKGKCPGCGAVIDIPSIAAADPLPPGPLLETTPPIKMKSAPAPGAVAWEPPPAPAVQPPEAVVAQTSGWAIASLVGAFLCGPVGAILGFVAMSKIKKSRGALSGFGLALAGAIIGTLWTFAGIGGGVLMYWFAGFATKTVRIGEAFKAINTAEGEYFRKANAYWTADVAGLEGLMAPVCAADGDATGARPYQGYFFIAMDSDETGADLKGGADSYAFCAYPAEKGSMLAFTFIMSRHGGVLMGLTEGRPQRTWPSASQIGQGKPWQRLDLNGGNFNDVD